MKIIVFSSFVAVSGAVAVFADIGAGDPRHVAGGELNLLLSSLKVAAALGMTLVLLVATVYVLKKIMGQRTMPGLSGSAISVLEIRYIAPKKSIALVKVVDRVMIVGMSDQSLTSLGELNPDEIGKLKFDDIVESGSFKSILSGFTKRGNPPTS